MLFKLEATFVADGLNFKFSSDLCEVVDVLIAKDNPLLVYNKKILFSTVFFFYFASLANTKSMASK